MPGAAVPGEPLPEASVSAKPAPRKAAGKAPAAEAAPEPAPVKPGRAAKTKAAPLQAAPMQAAPLQAAPEPPLPEAPLPEAPAPATAAASADLGALVTPQASAVLQAIQDGAAIELLFVDADANPPRTFEPRQLIFDALAKAWYVWGWDRRYNAERHHRLDLVAQVNAVEGMGRAAQGPYKEGTPANQVGGWLGGEPIQVKAVLLKQWIFAVRQAPAPFPEFRIEEVEEGKAQVTFTGTDLRAIARWAMQFGDGIQVIEPQRLQDRIKQVGIAWGGKAAAPAPPAKPAPAPRPEPRHEPRHEPRNEARHEARESQPEPRRRPEPQRQAPEAPKPAKPGKIEIRFDRL